jgi:3-oxoadipate enol-lactonase
MPLIDLDTGARLFCNHQPGDSDKPTFVFVNSSGATASAWIPVTSPLRAAGYGNLCLDLRGQGSSEYPETSRFDTEEIVGDLDAALTALGIGRTILVGLSVGGLRAANLAKLRAGVVGLVLINTLRKGGPLTDWVGALECRLMSIGGTQLVQDAFRPVTVGGEELGLIRPRHLLQTPYEPMPDTHPRRRMAEAAREANWNFDWPGLTMPVLVLTGMHDRLFRVQSEIDAILANMPTAREVRFENEGHALHSENPARTADELLKFAAGLPS